METTIVRHRTEFQVVLLFLGGIQFLNGVWATVSPSGFYGDFPFGWGWVEALPAYNEHLMRDVGGLFLATGFILLAAAWFMERRLTILALVSYLLFAVPHAIYHYLNLEPYDGRDTIANVIVLGATVVLPLWLLWRLRAGAATEHREADPGSI